MSLVWLYTFYVCSALIVNASLNYFLNGSFSVDGLNAMFLVLVFGVVHVLGGLDTIIKEIKENR